MFKLIGSFGSPAILTLLLVSSSAGFAGSIEGLKELTRWGTPQIERFYSSETHVSSEVQSISSLPSGELALLTNSSMIVYDGTTWTPLSGMARPHSSANTPDGRTIVSFEGGLMEYRKDSFGEYSSRLLTPPETMPMEYRALETVATARGHSFGLRGTDLIEVDANSTVYHHKLPSWASSVFSIGEDIYVTGGLTSLLNRWDWDLKELVDNSSVLDHSVYEWIVASTPRAEGGAWLLTAQNKILGFDGERSWIWGGTDEVQRRGLQVRNFVEASPNKIVIGSASNGLFFFGEEGSSVIQISKDEGLDDFSIEQLGVDGQGGLWVVTKRSISRIHFDFSTLIFDERHGLTNTSNVIEIFDGRMYVGTDVGLYVSALNPSNSSEAFQLIDHTREISDLYAYRDHLFITGTELKVMNKDQEFTEYSQNGGTCLWQPSANPDVMLVGTYGGTLRLEDVNGEWVFGGLVPGAKREIYSMVESKEGVLWGSLGNGEIARIHVDDTEFRVEVVPIPAQMNGVWSMAVEVDGEVYINSNPALRWDDREQRFLEAPEMIYYVGAPPFGFEQVFGWSRDRAYVCINSRRGTTVPRPNDRVIGDIASLGNSVDTRGLCLIYDEEGNAWAGGSFGLVRSSDPLRKLPLQSGATRIHKIVSIKDGKRLAIPEGDDQYLVLEPDQDSIRLEIEFPNLVFSEYNQYQIFVEEVDAGYPGFSDINFREFTNLHPGNYTIHMDGLDATGRTTSDRILRVTLLPHWYEKPWAYLLYVLALVGVGVLLVKRSERRHAQRRMELERLVLERTNEIEEKNLSLEKQAETLESQNFELAEKTEELQQTTASLTETLRQLEATQDQLVATARTAGKAEIATSVLHNVGNVLNSVNISLDTLAERVSNSQVSRLKRLAKLIESKKSEVSEFLTQDRRGKAVPDYLIQLAEALSDETSQIAYEIASMEEGVEHIKRIISAQQTHAKSVEMGQDLNFAELCRTALTILGEDGLGGSCEIVSELDEDISIRSDKHRVLEILLNLISNAKDAVAAQDPVLGVITISAERLEETREVALHIKDNGIGIAPEKASELFQYGFTTKQNGHGFGLHGSANAATELGGKLSLDSRGIGKGATATLTLPVDIARP